jgi:hypothetical protein
MGTTATPRNRPAIAIACLLALLGFATVVALSVRDADAKSATIIGKTKKTPSSSCPGGRCKITVSVTAVQTVADGSSGVMKVPGNGHLVAWSVDLGKVDTKDQPDLTDGLNEKYGAPKARIAVLKAKKHRKFKLTKQSPKVDLSSKLGTTPIITLKKPLKVKKGQRIGLTTPGWMSDFEWGLPSADNQWIASRNDGACSEKDAPDAKPQQKVGSTRQYGCRFKGERLLYWAYFVPSGGGKKN